ncbi:MAG: ParB/RepB/Spo0J family partition protein [Nitrososphaerota archaeon]|jgi:ParB-like chromosome segregation protein Spo0J|nr:ParB/RepB/Spo0J family partition protein [Nitrososphaerota archaeon]
MSLRLNPEYDNLLPHMSEEEFAELKNSIETEGQHYPIIVNENLEVLDGHHRFRACIALGIEPDFEVKQFDDKLIEKKFVIEANLRRRHLNNFQLVELAVPLLEIEKAIAKQHAKNNKTEPGPQQEQTSTEPFQEPPYKGRTAEAIAKKAGVSTRTLERGKKIIEQASEDDKQKLREGKTSIARVYQEIINEEKPSKPLEENECKVETVPDAHNKTELLTLLERLLNKELYCPECGNNMLECNKCHKSLKQLLKKSKSDEQH